ncbi:AraC family transcriptional regulator [Paenibacillus sp.]|uniref:helix-turn-helix transcriptional regulator n=1 Tax=Paenibacillus sp. TaxID=58172 RepID=UPI002D2A7D0D|nr:AraC family transcriptional regulator [Paenibacillus sp.]HZG84567.1 AraC family transcriptional regulator [Paenibacillus sp.]
MNTNTTDIGILNELSEMIALRMKSFMDPAHDGDWVEHKSHADYDLWFIQSGIVKIAIHGTEHTARPGDVVLFYPGIPYIASTIGSGCRFIYVHFDFGIGQQQRILDDFQLSGVVPGELVREETALFDASYVRSKGNRLYMKACLTAVLAKIIELHGQGAYIGTFAHGKSSRKTGGSLDVLQRVFQYVDERLHTAIKMSELAAIAGVSEKYFISYFKKIVGITPGQYIYQIKMNRARDYLYQKKYTVQQIASFLGYPDPFTFSKAFKKYYRVPPSKFE